MLNIEDAVVSAKTGVSTENAEQIVKELHDRYVLTMTLQFWRQLNAIVFIGQSDLIRKILAKLKILINDKARHIILLIS